MLETLADGQATIDTIVERIYVGYPREVLPLAARSILAHLKKLETEGRVERVGRGETAPWTRSGPRECERCGKPVRSRSRFCPSCNLVMLQEAAPATPEPAVELVEVTGDREPWVALLLEADEEEPLRGYLHDGALYEIRSAGETVGVVLLLHDGATIEIKNLALDEEYRGKGLGRASLDRIVDHATRAGAERVVVGTSDTSRGTIAFYRACGFADAGRRLGFFDAYPTPVIEDGAQAHDMVMFERVLGRRGDGERDPTR